MSQLKESEKVCSGKIKLTAVRMTLGHRNEIAGEQIPDPVSATARIRCLILMEQTPSYSLWKSDRKLEVGV